MCIILQQFDEVSPTLVLEDAPLKMHLVASSQSGRHERSSKLFESHSTVSPSEHLDSTGRSGAASLLLKRGSLEDWPTRKLGSDSVLRV